MTRSFPTRRSADLLGAVLAAYLHAFGANLVSAAVRLIPLGQTDGQRALAALIPVAESAVAKALTTKLDDCGTAVPMVDLCSMQHETQYTRLFRSCVLPIPPAAIRSEEHTSELQSLMRFTYAIFCL